VINKQNKQTNLFNICTSVAYAIGPSVHDYDIASNVDKSMTKNPNHTNKNK
jgi:hypothetical protein